MPDLIPSPPAKTRRPFEDLGREIIDAFNRAFGEPKPLWPYFGELLAPIIERDHAEVLAAAEASSNAPSDVASTSAVAQEIWEAYWTAVKGCEGTVAKRFAHAVEQILERDRAAVRASVGQPRDAVNA